MQNYATADPPEVVVAFYEERLGPPQRDAEAGSATWHFSESRKGLRGGQHLEVWPVDRAYPFRNNPDSDPNPPDTKTVVNRSYLYTPEEEPKPS